MLIDMEPRTLDELCREIPGLRVSGDGAVPVSRVSHDSRTVVAGDLFACLEGGTFDGHRFAAQALERGAAGLLVSERRAGEVPQRAPLLLAEDTRRAMASVAAALHGYPSRRMKLAGVTGTNGKTTTTLLIASILKAAGMRTGTIGTLGAELMGERLESAHTTPESDQLQEILGKMADEGARAVVMEVSSHALAQNRVLGCEFDSAVFTNLTQDHLDFHAGMEDYFQAKLRLFTDPALRGGKPMSASVNLDDPRGEQITRFMHGRVWTYGVRNASADVRASEIEATPSTLAFRLQAPEFGLPVRLSLGGGFQVYNALAAAAAAIGMGISADAIAEGLSALRSVPGRFESVPNGRGIHVLVDYAHTPDGLENVLRSARELAKSRLIVVFGCGGNRDRTKRPLMGEIANRLADFAVVTSDNPRDEEPEGIAEEIREGIYDPRRALLELDRRTAIAKALEMAAPGDVVVIAGKGHEDYQIVKGQVLPFDDRKVAAELMGSNV